MTETKVGIDVSAWTGPISDETWAALRGQGVEVGVIGLWHGASANPHALQQLAGAVHAGCEVAGYVALAGESGATGALQVSAGMTPVGWPALVFLSPDVELASVTPDMVSSGLACIRAAGYRPIIYTGAWFWNWWLLREHEWFYQHPEGFSDCPAWLANYDSVPELDTAPLGMLGRVVGKQYAGTTEFVPGCVVDLNVFDAAWIREGEMTLTAQDKAWVLMNSGGQKLVRGSAPMVWIVTSEGKVQFPGNEVAFVTVGFHWEDVIVVTDDVLAAIPRLA